MTFLKPRLKHRNKNHPYLPGHVCPPCILIHPEQATIGTGGAINCPQPRSPTDGLSVNLLALIIFYIGIDQTFLRALII
jgi:hypothetical protein